MTVFRIVDPVAPTTLQSYEHWQLLHRTRRYVYIKGAVNVVVAFLFLLTFPPELRPKMVAIALADALLLVPYWFLLQRYPTLATCLSLGITSLAISAGDWVGGYQTGASGILYALLILGGHLVLVQPRRTYLVAGLVTAVYASTIVLEVKGVIPIRFPFTMSNLSRVVSLNVISMFGLTVLTNVVTRLYRELLRRNKELFALNAVSTAASQSLDLDEVLQLALDKTLEATGMDSGGILLPDPSGDKFVLETHRGGSPELIQAFREVKADESFMSHMMESILVIDDFSELTEDRRVAVEREGLQALASVPLKSKDAALGVMVTASRSLHTFTSQDLELLSAIGNQIGMALENARLYAETQRRLGEQTALREAGTAISSTLDLEAVLSCIAEQMGQTVDATSAYICTYESETMASTVLAEYIGPQACPQERVSDLGVTYVEDDMDYLETLQTGKVDIAHVDSPDLAESDRLQMRLYGVQTMLYIPLLIRGRLIGFAELWESRRRREFTPEEIALCQHIAQQAAVAIENARLYETERDRRRIAEALREMAEVIGSTLDLNEVLKRVLEQLREVLDYDTSSIMILEGDRFQVITVKGFTGREEVLKRSYTVDEVDISWEAIQKKQALLVADVTQDPRWTYEPQTADVRAWIGAPLIADGEVIGLLTVDSYQVGKYNQDDAQLVMTFARQAAMATKNSRLYEREQKRAVQLAVVNEVGRRAASILDMDQLLQEVVVAIQQGFNYHNVALSLLDKAAGELEVLAVAGGFADLVSLGYRQAVGVGMAGWTAQSGQPLLANDVSQEPRYILGYLDEPLTKAELCVPLKLAGQVIGVLDIQCTYLNAFDETDLLAMETLTDQIAIAIQNARFFEETKRRLEEITALYQTSLDITAQLEMSELLESIVERAVTLLWAQAGGVYLYDAQREELRLAIAYGHSKKYVGVTLKGGEGMAGKVFQTREPLIMNNYRTWGGRAPVYEADQPFTAVLGVPLRWRERIIGVLALDADAQQRTFNQNDIWLATLFANQATIAIANARIYEEERKRALQLELIGRITQRIASILDLDELLSQVVRLIADTFGYHYTSVLLTEADSDELVVKAAAEPLSEALKDRLQGRTVREGITVWVAHSGEPLLANDVSREPRYCFLEELKDTRSELAVPIRLKGEIMGVLDAQSIERDAFSQDDVFILQTLADQLAIAIENARLYATEHQQLHRLEQLAAASQQITANLDLSSVLKKIGDQALTTLDADRAAIFLLDWETDRLSCAYSKGLSPDYVNAVDHRHRGLPGTHVLSFSEPIHVVDAQTGATTEGTREGAAREGFHTFTVLPLRRKGEVMGALAVYRDVIKAFSPEELAIAQSFANQAAVAIENAQLYQQTDEKLQARVRELAALYSVAERVNYFDLDAVLQLALDSAMGVTGMDAGGIMVLDPSTDELFLRAHRVASPELCQAVSCIKADEGLVPRMLESVLVIDDLSKVTKDRRVAIEKEGFQSLVNIPLKAQESSLGVMVLGSYSPRTFTSEELELLTAIGNQVGVAIDRANLQVQELRAAILEERQYMAHQMHDDIAQTLGYLGLQVDSVMGTLNLVDNVGVQATLEGIRRAIEDAYERVRGSIVRLQEDVPAHFDLGTALSEIISDFEKQARCRVESSIDEGQLPLLPPSVAFQLTHIIREALTNVRKHSGADSVQLTLQGLEDGGVQVTIQDDGRGFDLDGDRRSGWEGFGLRFMRERAERMGGSLEVESQPGQGTRVIVSLGQPQR
jgi:GAF domain-containing protein/two-component sensor histidine kinase